MQIRSISSPHAKHLSISFEIEGEDTVIRVLTVETDLKLNAKDPAYNTEKVDELLEQLQASMGDLYDRAVLKQQAPGA